VLGMGGNKSFQIQTHFSVILKKTNIEGRNFAKAPSLLSQVEAISVEE
jgi:hypothetical protein